MWVLLLISIIPHDGVVRDECDFLEDNYFYDDNGNLVFEQYVFYTWNAADERLDVRFWRMKKPDMPSYEYDFTTQQYTWMFPDNEVIRKVSVKSMIESHTQYDVELVNRELCPVAMRLPLSAPKPRKRK